MAGQRFDRLVLEAVRRRVRAAIGGQCFRTYPSFAAASAGVVGYADPAIIDVVALKTERFRASRQANVPATGQLTVQGVAAVLSVSGGSSSIDVVELGGACGATFFELDAVLPDLIRRWRIVETAGMVAAAAPRFGDDRLRFHQALAEVNTLAPPDLVFCQGTLQFIADPASALASLLLLRPRAVYVARTLVSTGIDRPVYTRLRSRLSAHGPGPLPTGLPDHATVTPTCVMPFDALTSCLEPEYRLVVEFEEGEDLPELACLAAAESVRNRGFIALRVAV